MDLYIWIKKGCLRSKLFFQDACLYCTFRNFVIKVAINLYQFYVDFFFIYFPYIINLAANAQSPTNFTLFFSEQVWE